MSKLDTDKVVSVLNRILEAELAGVVRYTHYSFLVFGFGRIPIVSWLREQASESLETEGNALALYRELLGLVEGRLVALEEFARQMIHAEELHASEVDKMLRKPGELTPFSPRTSKA